MWGLWVADICVVFLQYPTVQVVAVCDPDQSRREYSKRATEEAYARTRPGSTSTTCHTYNDLRELLARGDVDAVVIATGDNWHGAATVMAAKAGKDIYCEKPISKPFARPVRWSPPCDVTAACVKSVCNSGARPSSSRRVRWFAAGAIGKVRHVYVGMPGTCYPVNLPPEPAPPGLDWNQWLGPAPWRPFNRRFHHYGRPPHVVPWHFCPDFGGGNLTSNTVHAFDVVQWGLGRDESGPVEIVPPETKKYPVLTYEYADGVVVQVASKLDRQKLFVPKGWVENTRIQNFGALFIGQEGWIHVGRQGYLKSFPEEILKNPVGEAISVPIGSQPPPELVRLYQNPPNTGVRRVGRLPVDHRFPPWLHCPLDGPCTVLGPPAGGVSH